MTPEASAEGGRSRRRQTLHELKNHLGAVLGAVELLVIDTPVEDERRADLVSVEAAVREAIALLPGLDLDDPFTPAPKR